LTLLVVAPWTLECSVSSPSCLQACVNFILGIVILKDTSEIKKIGAPHDLGQQLGAPWGIDQMLAKSQCCGCSHVITPVSQAPFAVTPHTPEKVQWWWLNHASTLKLLIQFNPEHHRTIHKFRRD
jgi:hypothetical protein